MTPLPTGRFIPIGLPALLEEAELLTRFDRKYLLDRAQATALLQTLDPRTRVLTIDGEPPPPELAGYKDTVYVAPRSTVRLLVKFSDYADPEWPYMYHCHLLLHEDMGIMGQFVVVRPGQKVVPPPRPQSHNLMPGMPSPSAPAVAPTADASTPSHDVHSLRRGSVDPG